MMTQEELKQLWSEHESEAEWEKYDFVDPPYCWACIVRLEVDGYIFTGDGCMTCGERDEINELWCDTPEGEHIQII